MCKIDLNEWSKDDWQLATLPPGATTQGGPPVCARALAKQPNGTTRRVVDATYEDGSHNLFVFDDNELAGYCCFDAHEFADGAAFAEWARKRVGGTRFYTCSYKLTDCAPGLTPNVECPPPLAQFTLLPDPREIKLAA